MKCNIKLINQGYYQNHVYAIHSALVNYALETTNPEKFLNYVNDHISFHLNKIADAIPATIDNVKRD